MQNSNAPPIGLACLVSVGRIPTYSKDGGLTVSVFNLVHFCIVLSGTNSLKSVQFFKLVLRYDYSIVLYMFLACTMQ